MKYGLSKGNYYVDSNGNVILDLHANFNTLPLGYNHYIYKKVSIHKFVDLLPPRMPSSYYVKVKQENSIFIGSF